MTSKQERLMQSYGYVDFERHMKTRSAGGVGALAPGFYPVIPYAGLPAAVWRWDGRAWLKAGSDLPSPAPWRFVPRPLDLMPWSKPLSANVGGYPLPDGATGARAMLKISGATVRAVGLQRALAGELAVAGDAVAQRIEQTPGMRPGNGVSVSVQVEPMQ